MLHKLHRRNIIRKYCLKFTPEKKADVREKKRMTDFKNILYLSIITNDLKMMEKVVASHLFKNKKDSYAQSVAVKFKDNRLIDSDVYKIMPKQKQDVVSQKKFMTNSQSEKQIVRF